MLWLLLLLWLIVVVVVVVVVVAVVIALCCWFVVDWLHLWSSVFGLGCRHSSSKPASFEKSIVLPRTMITTTIRTITVITITSIMITTITIITITIIKITRITIITIINMRCEKRSTGENMAVEEDKVLFVILLLLMLLLLLLPCRFLVHGKCCLFGITCLFHQPYEINTGRTQHY